MDKPTQPFFARPVGPGGRYLVRTLEAVGFTEDQTAEVLAYRAPVPPAKWAGATVRRILGEAARDHLTLDGPEADGGVVVQALAEKAQREAKRPGQAPRYVPVGAEDHELIVTGYRRLLAEGELFETLARSVGGGELRIWVHVERWHDLDGAAALLAAVDPQASRMAGMWEARMGLIEGTNRRLWPVQLGKSVMTDAAVERWRQVLVKCRIFPGET